MRLLFLSSAFALVVVMGGLTIWVIVRTGIDVISVASILILVMIGLGLYGAITNPPPD